MNYHPDIELLLKYASGQLEPALSVAVGVHMQECKQCEKSIAELEAVGGATLESTDSKLANQNNLQAFSGSDSIINTDPELSFDKLMADVIDLPVQPNSNKFDDFAVAEMDRSTLQLLSERNFESLHWQSLTKNIAKATIAMNDPKYQVELLRFAPNAKIPQHTHTGSEITVVLEGQFSDKVGTYTSGEFIVNDSSVEHQPLAGDQGCVCLAITDAPLKFTGTFGPLINWWVK